MTVDDMQAELTAIAEKLDELGDVALRLVELSTALHLAIVGPVPGKSGGDPAPPSQSGIAAG